MQISTHSFEKRMVTEAQVSATLLQSGYSRSRITMVDKGQFCALCLSSQED